MSELLFFACNILQTRVFSWLILIYANENELEKCSFKIMLNLSLYVPVGDRYFLVSHKGFGEKNASSTVKMNELTLEIS